MDRSFDFDTERLRDDRAATLENANREPFRSGLKGDAKTGGRCLMRRLRRTKQRNERAMAFLCRHRKPPQLGVPNVMEPRQQRMATSPAQYLLSGPQPVAPPRRMYDREILKID
ncbi:MAG: hypothetical protein ACM3IK_07360, partial [Sphingomonadaceae bacterium]